MPAKANFSVKWQLAEANVVRDALRLRMDELRSHLAGNGLTDEEREEAGRIETILRRDFG